MHISQAMGRLSRDFRVLPFEPICPTV